MTEFYQDGLFPHYKTAHVDGLCNGLVIEFARHYYAHKAKGTKPDFMAKLNKQLASPTDSFLERVKAYQNYYQVNEDPTIYRTSYEIFKLIDNPQFSNSEILGVAITPIGTLDSPHLIAIGIERDAANQITGYTIFDPNDGIIPCNSRRSLYSNLFDLKQSYIEDYNYENVSLAAIDLGSKLKEIGLVSDEQPKEAKNHYKFIEAINTGNIQKALELNKAVKIDYAGYFISSEVIRFNGLVPGNPLELVIFKCTEEQLIQVIKGNPMLDLTKSLDGIILILIATEKLSMPVIDALLSKLPPDNSWIWDLLFGDAEIKRSKELLNGFKTLLETTNSPVSIKEEEGHTYAKIHSNDPIIIKYLQDALKKIEDDTNFKLSKFLPEDIEVSIATLSHNLVEKSIELHIDWGKLPIGFLGE